jgi:tungstate transport system substrate-binding protein
VLSKGFKLQGYFLDEHLYLIYIDKANLRVFIPGDIHYEYLRNSDREDLCRLYFRVKSLLRVIQETVLPPVLGKEDNMKKNIFLLFILIFSSIYSIVCFADGQVENYERLKLATTTSTDNTGLLDELLPAFTTATGIAVDVIAVGTGKAIALGENGDVDIIMVHARSKEDNFISEGYGVNRKDLMHNDFVILGPSSDPAGISVTGSAAEALEIISKNKSDFISRGDDSGTHTREKELWSATGITPSGTWYKEAGQGMGAVITMANDLEGYTLADRGTFLAMRGNIDLVILIEGDNKLFNPYGIIAVNPALHEHTNYEGAMSLITFLTSRKGQSIIGNFRKNGEQLFYPDVIK